MMLRTETGLKGAYDMAILLWAPEACESLRFRCLPLSHHSCSLLGASSHSWGQYWWYLDLGTMVPKFVFNIPYTVGSAIDISLPSICRTGHVHLPCLAPLLFTCHPVRTIPEKPGWPCGTLPPLQACGEDRREEICKVPHAPQWETLSRRGTWDLSQYYTLWRGHWYLAWCHLPSGNSCCPATCARAVTDPPAPTHSAHSRRTTCLLPWWDEPGCRGRLLATPLSS